MSGINVKAKAYAFAFTFIRIEKVGDKELERIYTMVLSLQLLPFSLSLFKNRYTQIPAKIIVATISIGNTGMERISVLMSFSP